MEIVKFFNIRTRGNTPHLNKPKVYISYYCRDLDLAEKIAEILLVKKDCAVFFYNYENGDPDNNAIYSILEDVQVFAVPITEEYLAQSHNAKMFELPTAQKYDIPQLPFLCPNVPRNTYKSVFGTTHSFRLDPENSASFYHDESLSLFLDEHLQKDTQIVHIRSAFPYHVFLSYRKQDRPSVQPVMEKIHNNNLCQYVSVWYDKYLTAGRAFDSTIEEKITNSDVFAVLVSPALLEKNEVGGENYIVAYEYPAACASRANILPIELDAVDHTALNDKLPGIFRDVSRPVKADDCTGLCKEICRMLPDQERCISSLTKDQLYYIGIAYYNGIEAERNYTIARQFFEKAADEGHLEANDRLAYMYYHGDGVQRDSKKAAVIQLTVFSKIIEKAAKTLDYVDAEEILYSVTRCCTFLRSANQGKDTSTVCEKAIKTLQKLTTKKPGIFNELLGDAYAASGHYALLRGDWDQAIVDYKRAIQVLTRHYGKNGNRNNAKLSGCRQSASIAIKHVNDFKKAEEYLLASLKDLDNIPREWTEDEYSDYANTCNSLINIKRHFIDDYLDHQLYEEVETAANSAKEYYDKAITIYQRIDSLPVKRYEADMAELMQNYGLVLKMLCRWVEAEVLLVESHAICKKLYDKSPQGTLLELARINMNLANLYSEPGCKLRNIKKAKTYFKTARSLYESYPEKDSIPYEEERMKYYFNVARFGLVRI